MRTTDGGGFDLATYEAATSWYHCAEARTPSLGAAAGRLRPAWEHLLDDILRIARGTTAAQLAAVVTALRADPARVDALWACWLAAPPVRWARPLVDMLVAWGYLPGREGTTDDGDDDER